MPSSIAAPPPTATVFPAAWHRQGAYTLDAVDALEDAWRELEVRTSNPLGYFTWVRAALRAFEVDAQPHIVAVSHGGRLQALAPLASCRVRGIRRLTLAGVHELHEPADLLWEDPQALSRLVLSIARRGTPLVFERMPADSPAVAEFERCYRWRAFVLKRPRQSCPYIELDESWVEPESHLNAGRRSDLRRARRRAEQFGPVTTELHTPSLKELSYLVDTALAVEARSWKGESGTALVHDPHRAAFYRRYFEAACVEGILRICFLRIGDHVAAAQVAIEESGGFWLLKVGYDERFAASSPGMLLMRETIRYAAEAGLKTYEFLGRAESWTRVWTATEHDCISMSVYPLGVRGMAALAFDLAAAGYKKWKAPQSR
jgi:CelD/BcsL family acetyltransferase involved in cellulose biosynthesis